MKLLTVHHRNVAVSYKHKLCSCASVFVFIVTSCSVLVPLLLVFVISPRVWLENVMIWEQAQVQFNYQYNFVGFETDTGKLVACTSFAYQKEVFEASGQRTSCSNIKFLEQDLDMDGRVDEMEFTIVPGRRISKFSLQLFFESQVTKFCNFRRIPTVFLFEMELHPDESIQRKVFFNELQLNQRTSFNCPVLWRHQETHFRPLNLTTRNLRDMTTQRIFEKLRRNPGHFEFVNKRTFDEPIGEENSLVFKFAMPEVMLRFETPVWHKVLQMWIKFLAVFILFFLAVNKFKDFAFTRYWVRAWEVVPWKKGY